MAVTIDGNAGVTLPDGDKAVGFAVGTKMLFQQTAAPTGWTKDTSHDNKALRVVSGTASTGGSVDFTTAFASGLSAGSTTLSTAQMPSHSHTHNSQRWFGTRWTPSYTSSPIGADVTVGHTGSTINNNGSSDSHNHTIPSFAVAYVDLIIAAKD
jgi:microcystin-dependent protein